MIVSGSASQVLADALAQELDEPLAPVTYERFPDGEFLASVPGFDGDRAIVVAATTSSDAHIELLQLQDAVREAGAEEIVTVIPYLGYGRQDDSFDHGEPISVRAMARAISSGCDQILTVNPHEPDSCRFFTPAATAVDAAGQLADPLPAELEEPIFLAPDEGAVNEAETVRDAYGRGSVDYFVKHRESGDTVEVTPSELTVEGRDVVVVDDIVATGSTMCQAIGHLTEQAVGAVHVACVHPVLVDGAYSRLQRAGVTAIHGTDTIEHPTSAVSAAPAIAAYL